MSSTFADWAILADSPTIHVRHPIRKKQPISGSHPTHEPSFSQQNRKLYLFESIDFNAKKPKLLRERAGFMAYMFTDLRQAVPSMEAYSIVRPANESETGEAIVYAKIVNWADAGGSGINS